MWRLTRDSGALDLNSPYAYLLLCRHFPDTCLVADSAPGLIGFVTGYRPPEQPDTIFVWQIAVDASARRTGLGGRLVEGLLERTLPAGVRYLEATVTPGNRASRGLFEKVARAHGTRCVETPCFPAEVFPDQPGDGPHEPEVLLRLGPFEPSRARPQDDQQRS